MNPGEPCYDPFEGCCCWACATKITRQPEALRALLSAPVALTLKEIAMARDNENVDMLKGTVTVEFWRYAQNLAREAIESNPRGKNTRLFHPGFGQTKAVHFAKLTSLKIEGKLKSASVLQVLCKEENRSQLKEMFKLLAFEMTEPNVAIQMYKDLQLNKALESVVMFDLKLRRVTVFYPSIGKWDHCSYKLQGAGTDLYSLRSRVSLFLRQRVSRWRGVIINDVWGLGAASGSGTTKDYPIMHHWIQLIREVSKESWILLGAVIPEDYKFKSSTSIPRMLNVYNNYEDVYIADFSKGQNCKLEQLETWDVYEQEMKITRDLKNLSI